MKSITYQNNQKTSCVTALKEVIYTHRSKQQKEATMKFLVNVIKTEQVEVKRQYETVTRFKRINTGETKEVEFKPEQNLLIVDGEEFKVCEVLAKSIKIGNEEIKTAELMTYKNGQQHLFYSLDVPAFWDKFDDLKWGKKVFGGYVKI